ncbi:Cell surface mannoprotein mp65 [Exophiala xenobiotica]|nr:Cell surface mannoprotein mp65 [Exophiala xenobiotica]KAK5251416.1 Cell surface mannoprotein mp65 [Exophiala xenobiotica]KAK5345938.1 Cell surface mannoprotein mp65 [Exophiala xenobiotica]KAK5364705.1 Cell surface mannoprotein mp65 [Exophiala xenobiotica]KAK5378210.1 Cell surface mannoprotein mp65 [Exophiala xenobiotica]
MKAIVFAVAALCAQVGLAVPHAGNQKHRHAARHEATYYSTITDIVTVTAPNAVIWVDQYNNVISTEYRGDPETATATDTATNDLPAVSSIEPVVSIPTPTENVAPTASSSSDTSATASLTPSPSTDTPTDAAVSSPPAATSTFQPPTPVSSASAVATSSVAHHESGGDGVSAGGGFGICYELIGDSGCKTLAQMNSDFAFLVTQGFSTVRTYDIGCDLGPVAQAAASNGLQLIAGLNIVSNVAADIQKLIGFLAGNWGPVDTIVVGNEVVNNGGNAADVVAALAVARAALTAAGYTKNVVTVDVWSQFIAHPELCTFSDYCAANAHAYFDINTTADEAGGYVAGVVTKLGPYSGGKSIVITESGWPYQGDPNGLAIPSPANQQTAISGLRSAFAGNPGGLFLFQAYDASYKAPGPLGVEQFFGIYGH